MITNLIFFFSVSLLISFSSIGYGLITIIFLKIENLELNYGLIGILGLFFISVLGSYTHLILPHDYIHNSIIILIGILFLIIFRNKNFNQIKTLFIIFCFLFISILLAKTNEDFGYYHLPNSIQFAQQKLQFGLGNINHGFKHISSIFQLMSLNYLPFFKYNLFNLTNFLFLLFFVLFVIINFRNNYKSNLNITNIFIILFLILFVAKFSRIAEYGSDIAGQITIVFFLFYTFEIAFNQKLNDKYLISYFKISIIFITFAITLKFILVIYSILYFFVVLVIFKKKLFITIFKEYWLFLPIIALGIFIFYNFSSTGCLIYPIQKVCFSQKYEWALSSETVNYLNFHYEIWAKGGKGPNFSVENPNSYIESFNWVSNWISKYFIGKFTDFLLVTLTILFFFFLVYLKNFSYSKFKFKNFNSKYIFFYFNLLIVFIIWFLNFPTLRYAGFVIVFMIISFPFVLLVDEVIDFSLKSNLKKLSIIFVITYTIFLIKNVYRINTELNLSTNEHHNFKNFPFFWVNNVSSEEFNINGHKVYKVDGMCWGTNSTCVRNIGNLSIKKKNNYIFYSKKNEIK